ncbi:MAG: AAA family ATPase [Prolixibacteraceae bacterium]|nr:AAA family ATPase [Prolixibacteraceae bacterium]
MLDLKEFIDCPKSLLIAPAGYGKTYTIASCLKIVEGKHLVLTHTNAGIASIYEKVKKLEVPNTSFQIETISSFAQNIALSFTDHSLFPPQESGKQYYKAITNRAFTLVKMKPIRKMIGNSFSGLFVDEYQDCTISQHHFIQQLAELFPTHLLGDPMQGIFNLDSEDPLVNLDDPEIMGSYLSNQFLLDTPWRWINQDKKELGEDLKKIRIKLERDKTPINDFSPYPNISCDHFDKSQLFMGYPYSALKQKIYSILSSNENVLFIHSVSANRDARIGYITLFPNRLYLIESIDHEGFYSLANGIDSFSANGESITSNVHGLLVSLFPKSEIEKWLQKERLTRKKEIKDESIYMRFMEAFENYKVTNEITYLAEIIEIVPKLTGKKSNYKDIYFSLLNAIKKSAENSSSVYSEMVAQRNIARRVGRKLYGKSIGTTLLTKGLECDTVVLLEEEPFDYKNQYVALTRGSKQVIVFQINKTKRQNKMKSKNETKPPINMQLNLW